MSNEKLEALKLGLLAPHDRQAIDTNRRVDAAHALGFEDGKREAEAKADAELDAKHADLVKVADKLAYVRRELLKFDAENKCLREAAPVDDGRRFEIWYRPFPDEARARVGFYKHETFSETCADAICQATDPGGQFIYEARPVEPKHVHEWTECTDGEDKLSRTCMSPDCDARQVAEWKDES